MVGRVKFEVWNERKQYWAGAWCKPSLLGTNIEAFLGYGFKVRVGGKHVYEPMREAA